MQNFKMYRYAEKQYNEATVLKGEIRIGTLYDFRKSEHERGIADDKEGRKTVSLTIENHDNKSIDDMVRENRTRLKKFKASLPMGGTGSIASVKHLKDFNAPDCYILCTSEYKSLETMQEFENADSCIEIINIGQFYKYLTITLKKQTGINLKYKGIKKINYQNTEEEFNGNNFGINPIYTKEEKFKKQGELRSVWQPFCSAPIEPIIINDIRISKRCKLISID
ncbi:MAG: hypothetical protein NTX45_24060 [Proteobacteria bacterium]|nr:hypothetical protein [Pseudomonadota bacterium]